MEAQNPRALRSLDYHHAPLADQLSGGVRQIEIDVFADAKGGRFAHPAIDPGLQKPGCQPTRTSIRNTRWISPGSR